MRTARIILLFALSITAKSRDGHGEDDASRSSPSPPSASPTASAISPVVLTANPTLPTTPPTLSTTPPTLSITPPSLSTTLSTLSTTPPTLSTRSSTVLTTPPIILTNSSTIFLTSSPTLSTATPTPTSILESFQFDIPKNATTCQGASFSWHFAGSSPVSLTISITNEQVPEAISPRSTPLVWRTLSMNVSSSAQAIVWPVVNVTQGWYAAVASNTQRTNNIFTQSPSFFVANGSDVRCLAALSATSTSSHLSSETLAGVVAGLVICVILIAAVLSVPLLWKRPVPTSTKAALRRRRPTLF